MTPLPGSALRDQPRHDIQLLAHPCQQGGGEWGGEKVIPRVLDERSGPGLQKGSMQCAIDILGTVQLPQRQLTQLVARHHPKSPKDIDAVQRSVPACQRLRRHPNRQVWSIAPDGRQSMGLWFVRKL